MIEVMSLLFGLWYISASTVGEGILYNVTFLLTA